MGQRLAPLPDDYLVAQLRGMSGLTLSESEAEEAARNLMGFVRLLAEIDGPRSERGGGEYAGDGSRHRIREAKGRPDRIRQRRTR
jgi:hypothetical protein